MDLDKALVASILALGPQHGVPAFKRAIERGISAKRLAGEGLAAFQFLQFYIDQYETLPNADMLIGKTAIDVTTEDIPPNSIDWFIDEVNNRHLHSKIQQGLKEVSALQEQRKPLEAYTALERFLESLRVELIGTANVESLFQLGPEVKAFYERLAADERGIETPWETLNDLTLGFWPEDLVLFAALTGVGKSWVAVLIALHAWNTVKPRTTDRHRVLFITTELSRMRVAMRVFACIEKISYEELTHGRLGTETKNRLFNTIDELLPAQGFYLVGGGFDFQLDSVGMAIETAKPDLVIVDGVYLLRSEGQTRTERMANIFDELKRLAKRKKVPIVTTTQFNRDVKKGQPQTMGVEGIALSAVGGWNADLVFGLGQTADMVKDGQMKIHALKVREAAGRDILCNWNLKRMDFSEISMDGGGGGDADEKGAPTQSSGDVPF